MFVRTAFYAVMEAQYTSLPGFVQSLLNWSRLLQNLVQKMAQYTLKQGSEFDVISHSKFIVFGLEKLFLRDA